VLLWRLVSQAVSPPYLHRFMAYVDALSWMDRACGDSIHADAPAPRAEFRKKAPRGRSFLPLTE
jgi:hypothetical protein